MKHIVYRTTSLIDDGIYIGVHSTDNINDGYLGSGDRIINVVKKYGKNKFKREILFDCESKEEAYWIESLIVVEWFIKRRDVYNVSLGGHMVGHTEEILEKMRKSIKIRMQDPKIREHISKKLTKYYENNRQL